MSGSSPEPSQDPQPTQTIPATTSATTARRELATAVILCLLGAAMILLAVDRSWASGAPAASSLIPTVTVTVTGRDLAPLAAGLGLLGLAATVALLATRGAVRQLVGVIVSVAGVATMIDSWLGRGRVDSNLLLAAPGSDLTASVMGWPWLAVLGGLALTAAGILTVARSRPWPGMSRRYDAPTAAPPTAPRAARSATDPPSAEPMLDSDAAWRALDRGEDPTVRG